MYAFRKDGTHTHEEMGLHMAVERPSAGIISNEPDGHPAVGKDGHCVAERRIHKIVSLGRICLGIENPFPIAKYPEVMSMEMPWMNLAVVGVQGIGVLYDYVHNRAQFEDVDAVSVKRVRGIGIGRGEDVQVVVARGRSVRRWRLVKGFPEFELESCEDGSRRRDVRNVVDCPFDVSVDRVLRGQEDEQSV